MLNVAFDLSPTEEDKKFANLDVMVNFQFFFLAFYFFSFFFFQDLKNNF